MKKLLALAILFCGLILSSPALAQPGGGQGMGPGGGMGQGRGMGRMYNPQSVTTIQGTVESPGPQRGRMRHVSWVVKTAQGNVTVHLGPAWYVNQQQIVLKTGDAVEVTGSTFARDGKTILLAKEIKVGGKAFQLRDNQGLPLWRGQGRQQPQ